MIGTLLLALAEEPWSTRVWAQGAAGERIVGAHLDALASRGVVSLHDRHVPGSSANIDHVVVAPSGIFVVDTKHYRGGPVRVRRRRQFLGLVPGPRRLFVGSHDCTHAVTGMRWQVEAVRRALDCAPWEHAIPIQPVLAFVGPGDRSAAVVTRLGGVLIARPCQLGRVVGRRGPLGATDVQSIARHVARRLPPA